MSDSPAATAPKKRVTRISKPELVVDTDSRMVSRAVGNLAIESDHNFQAVVQELDDIKLNLQLIMRHLGIVP